MYIHITPVQVPARFANMKINLEIYAMQNINTLPYDEWYLDTDVLKKQNNGPDT